MKTIAFKNPLFLMMSFVLTAIAFTSCGPDEETPEPPLSQSLIGTWDIDSYHLDDDEWIGTIVNSASITFEAPTGNSGVFSQEITFADGEVSTISARYVLDETNHQVTMYFEGEPILANVTITSGNKLHWESLQDEYPLIIKATKR